MKRLLLVACATLAIAGLPLRASAQPAHTHRDSPKATMIVTQELVVGTTVLQPGEYKFQCRTFDGKTFLVVTSAETGREITRVPCEPEVLDAKVPESEFRSLTRGGARVLTVVRIRGEAVAHRVAN